MIDILKKEKFISVVRNILIKKPKRWHALYERKFENE